MLEDLGTETKRHDASAADESLFGDAPDDEGAQIASEEDADEVGDQDPQENSEAAEEANGEGQADALEELKVVVSIRGGRAIIGVQAPSSDPHIESFNDTDLSGLAAELPAVAERAKATWEEAPKHPAYSKPAAPATRRNRRQQQAEAQEADAGEEAEQAQQQALRLF